MRTTLLVLLRDQLVRADFASGVGRGPTSVMRADPAGVDQLEALAERAAVQGGRLSGRVVVITDAVFSQTLDTDLRALRQATRAEVASALAYEAQMLSGIAAAELALDWAEVEDPRTSARQAWVTALPRNDLAELDRRIGALGGALAGVVHAAGLPRPIRSEAQAEWSRVEYWHDLRAELAGRPDQGLSLRFVVPDIRARETLPAAPDKERLYTTALQTPQRAATSPYSLQSGRSLQGSAQAESAVAFDVGFESSLEPPEVAERNAAATLHLDDEGDLRAWLTAWALEVGGRRRPTAPFVRPERQFLGTAVLVGLGLAAGLAVAALAVRGFDQLGGARAELQPRLAAAIRRVAAGERLRNDLQRERTRAATLATEAAARQAAPAGLSPGPRLVQRAMELFTSATPEEVRIDRFHAADGAVSCRGAARNAPDVESLGQRLHAAFAADGLELHRVVHELIASGPDLGLYQFELTLEPPRRGLGPPSAQGEAE